MRSSIAYLFIFRDAQIELSYGNRDYTKHREDDSCSRVFAATREKRSLCGTPIEIFARRMGTVTILIGRVIRNRYRIASTPHDRGNSGILESLSHTRIVCIAHVTALQFRRERYGVYQSRAREPTKLWMTDFSFCLVIAHAWQTREGKWNYRSSSAPRL